MVSESVTWGACMLLSGLALAASLVTAEPSTLVHRTMGMMLLGGNGQVPYETPTPEVVAPPAEAPAAAERLPAPLSSIAETPAPAPPPADGRPRPGQMPAPLAGSIAAEKPVQLAQTTTNEEILRRLEQLEQENRQLKQQMGAGSGGGQALSPAVPRAQMVPGWRISLYDWNPEGVARGGPHASFNMRNQRFTAMLGQRPIDRSKIRERHQKSTDQMFVYRFDGWLHVTRPGRYELGFEITCPFEHHCNLVVKVGDQQVFTVRDRKFDNTLLQTGIDLEARDYQIEMTFGLSQNRFFKFKPMAVTWYPMIRTPGELNFRDFAPGELLTEAGPGVPYGMPRN